MGLRTATAIIAIVSALPLPALAQETGDMPPPEATEEPQGTSGRDVFVPADFPARLHMAQMGQRLLCGRAP